MGDQGPRMTRPAALIKVISTPWRQQRSHQHPCRGWLSRGDDYRSRLFLSSADPPPGFPLLCGSRSCSSACPLRRFVSLRWYCLNWSRETSPCSIGSPGFFTVAIASFPHRARARCRYLSKLSLFSRGNGHSRRKRVTRADESNCLFLFCEAAFDE